MVYLPALALEQVTQYQFFRLDETGYGIAILSIYLDIYVYRYELMNVKKVTGVNLDLACVTIFVVCVFYTTAGEKDSELYSKEFCDFELN